MKLLKIVPSKVKAKKWTAIFQDPKTKKEKKVHFWFISKTDPNKDYTLHKDKERRERYRKRTRLDL